MIAQATSTSAYVAIACIPILGGFTAWIVRQLMAHARLLAQVTTELNAHIEADNLMHTDFKAIGVQVDGIRLEQMRVATQLATTNTALLQIGNAATHAAEAAATAVALAAASAARVVQQTAADTATVLAAKP